MPDPHPGDVDAAFGLLSRDEQALARAMAAVVDSSTVPGPWEWSGRSACLLPAPDATPERTRDRLHRLHQAGLIDIAVPHAEDPGSAVPRYRMPTAVAAHLAAPRLAERPTPSESPGDEVSPGTSERFWANIATAVAHAVVHINPRPRRYSPLLLAAWNESNLFADLAEACAWVDGERDTLLRVLADTVAARHPVALTLIEPWDIWRRYPRQVLAATQQAGIALILTTTPPSTPPPGTASPSTGGRGLAAVFGARLAHALVDLDRADEAVQVSDQAIQDARAVGDRYAEAAALGAHAHALIAAGQPRRAVSVLDQSRLIDDDPRHHAILDRHRAHAHHALGEFDTALAHLHTAHRGFHELGDRRLEGRVLTRIAEVLLDRHRPSDALRACDAAIAVLGELPADSALVAAHTVAARAVTALTAGGPPHEPAALVALVAVTETL